ncbi:MAG: MASE3 domain-containing protein, partial [Nitrospirota bacterium]|nr:MASE3 domain-containing protein [Nitrospirota bacterium]
MSQTKNMEVQTGQMPRSLIWAMLVLCVAPFMLNLVGVDFSSSKPGFPWAEVSTMAPHERIDAMFHTLSGSFTHTLLEWTAFLTAIFTLLLAFLHFTISRDVTTPIIGVALFCAGVMDAFHTLAADRLIESVADNRNLIPFTWAISRIFNALILIVGVGLFMHKRVKTLKGDLRFVLGISAGFLVLAYTIISYCANSAQLPQTMYPDSLITRPYDVAPLILFAVAGLTLFRWFHKQRPGIFTHALLLSMVPEVVVELHMAFGSTALF